MRGAVEDDLGNHRWLPAIACLSVVKLDKPDPMREMSKPENAQYVLRTVLFLQQLFALPTFEQPRADTDGPSPGPYDLVDARKIVGLGILSLSILHSAYDDATKSTRLSAPDGPPLENPDAVIPCDAVPLGTVSLVKTSYPVPRRNSHGSC
jgi:hypothetical protein